MRERRDVLGLTINEAAAKTDGISPAVWSKIENGRAENYRGRTIAAIDRALDWETGTARAHMEERKLTLSEAAVTIESLSLAVEALTSRLEVMDAELRTLRRRRPNRGEQAE